MFSKNLINLFELFYFEKGDFIIRQGFCSNDLYFIVSRKAKVYTDSPSGNITLLSFLTKFQTLRESASSWGKKPWLILRLFRMDTMLESPSTNKYMRISYQ